MKWTPFTYEQKAYPLDHLHSQTITLITPATNNKPEQQYLINVDYSLHCFTRGARQGEAIPSTLAYSDNREARIFDFNRYELSKLLPEIIADLSQRQCYHDPHGNFYIYETADSDGKKYYYCIFFTLSRAGKRAGLNLYVSSAYAKDTQPYKRKQKPIRFRVLAHNISKNKPVKAAP